MKGALALLITGGTENWAPGRWRERFKRVCPERPVALLPDDAIDAHTVRYAAVWKPKPGMLADFPKLEAIFNLGAGVDAVVADLTLPPVPLVRVRELLKASHGRLIRGDFPKLTASKSIA